LLAAEGAFRLAITVLGRISLAALSTHSPKKILFARLVTASTHAD
jgi:hypothetical protein